MENKRCIELDVMKFWGILLVVWGHVTNMYLPTGLVHPMVSSGTIGFVSHFVYSFHMPLFVFVSGCVYAFQYEVLGRRTNFRIFVVKKAKRLLVPYFIFGLLLVLLMCGCGFRVSFLDYAYNGLLLSKDSRHLWFVLMLFEVFIIFYIVNFCIEKFAISKWLLLLFSFTCYLVSSYIPYLLQINNAFRYLFWFTLGYMFVLHKQKVQTIVVNYLTVVGLLLAYLTVEHHMSDGIPFFSTITAMAGIMLIYQLSCDFKSISRFRFFRLVSENSFGIYLYHVFIIYLLFYFFKDAHVPAYVFSVSVFFISLLISVLLTIFSRSVGLRFIIGEKMNKEQR